MINVILFCSYLFYRISIFKGSHYVTRNTILFLYDLHYNNFHVEKKKKSGENEGQKEKKNSFYTVYKKDFLVIIKDFVASRGQEWTIGITRSRKNLIKLY